MTFAGPFGDNSQSNVPVVPLFTRVVATGRAEIFERDNEIVPAADAALFAEPVLRSIGITQCILAYRVGLAVSPSVDSRRPEIVFALDPVSFVGVTPDGQDDSVMSLTPMKERYGHPWRGSRDPLPDSERCFQIKEVRYKCEEFEAYEKEVYATDVEPPFEDERLTERRRLKVTGAECGRLLDEDRRRESEVFFAFSQLKEASILPRLVRRESGEDSDVLRHRLEAAL